MGNATRGRPRKEGARHPSGKLKQLKEEAPPAPPPPSETGRKAISGVIVQRMIENAAKLFGDQRFGTELARLAMAGQLTPSEVATGVRVAAVYGRFEYYKGLRRSAASPHYIAEFVADSADPETSIDESGRIRKNGMRSDRAVDLADREELEREATDAFRALQAAIPAHCRSVLEMLCVEDRHVGYEGLQCARAGFAIVKSHFNSERRHGAGKSIRVVKPRPAKISADPDDKPNPARAAFIAVYRKLSPRLGDDALNQAWTVYCALKSREDFRLEKSAR